MPGVAQMSVDNIVAEARETWAAGVPAVILFGIPERKDAQGSEAWNDNGEVQRAIREIKERVPGMVVITDVCLCEYTDHGHCGLIENGEVANDATLALARGRGALSCARRRRHHRAFGHDGRARRRRYARRWTGADSRSCRSWPMRRNIPVGILRSVSRGGAVCSAIRRPAQLSNGPGERTTRLCARWLWTWKKARTW